STARAISLTRNRQGKGNWCLSVTNSNKTTPPAGGVCISDASSPGLVGDRRGGGHDDRHDRDAHHVDASGYRATHNAPSTSHGRASGHRPSNGRYYPDRQSAV